MSDTEIFLAVAFFMAVILMVAINATKMIGGRYGNRRFHKRQAGKR